MLEPTKMSLAGNSEQKFITSKTVPKNSKILSTPQERYNSHFWYSKVGVIQIGNG
jgi:hypothetical protein